MSQRPFKVYDEKLTCVVQLLVLRSVMTDVSDEYEWVGWVLHYDLISLKTSVCWQRRTLRVALKRRVGVIK